MGARAQTKDSRKRGSQRRYHRAEFLVNREQDLLLPKPLIAPPTNEIQKKKNLLTCTKEKKQNLKWKETRGNEGERGEKRRGQCNFNGKEACKKLPRKGEQNKEPQNPNSPSSPKTKRIKKEKKRQTEKKFKLISNKKKK